MENISKPNRSKMYSTLGANTAKTNNKIMVPSKHDCRCVCALKGDDLRNADYISWSSVGSYL